MNSWFSSPAPHAALLVCALAGCAASASRPSHTTIDTHADAAAVVNRVTWGLTAESLHEAHASGVAKYLERQLHPGAAVLPAAVQTQIAAMAISQQPLEQLVPALEQQRRDADALPDLEQRKRAREAYQQALNRLARQAAERSLLRDLYSSNQLQENLSWFWLNHFNIHQGKHDLRAMVGDYEEHAIRAHALGKFRDLLSATLRHPAMLRYLDNERNAAGHLNENYARELMELHTLGVDGGYTQRDVQELARILTGVGIHTGPDMPKLKKALEGQYQRRGLFEFNPNRHDYGDKFFLGAPVKGRGLAEVDEAIDRLARHPATAHFISRKLAQYFVQDAPPPALVERMAKTFLQSDGDIAATLGTLFSSPEFAASLGRKFKDPMHYVVSAVRLAYGDKPILNPGPMMHWLQRMGEPLYGRQTPDGYPLEESAWASAAQMQTRFEIARAIGSGSAGLFKSEDTRMAERPAFPQLSNALYFQYLQPRLRPATRQALEQASSPQEWNGLLLSSPEMMVR